MIFQAMFAIITPALIIGAIAERIRFSALCIFIVLWTTLVYDPVCHWVWASGGFLYNMGALDFAGGTVVHINAGIAALIFALYLGKRKGYPGKISPPHNLPFAVLGTGLLWFGWFGFNGGSQLAADGRAANAFVVTHVAASAAALMWAILDWIINKKPTVLGMITGAVAGLVAITPASGFVNSCGAIVIGFGCSIICYYFVTVVKPKFGYDDSLDVFGVHGIGGIWGAIATGFLADPNIGGGIAGSVPQTIIQLKAVAATIVYTGIMTLIILFIVDKIVKLRVSNDDEKIGLDQSDHKESGYTLLE
jgi:Amt family ammonium transporter